MRTYFVVIEEETNGTFSAWVPGVSGVYAAADTWAKAKSAILEAIEAHLEVLKSLGKPIKPKGEVLLLKDTPKGKLAFTGFASLLGGKKSIAKARAARLNGRKGGRPPLTHHAR